MRRETCQVLILGAGPGGYVCAIRAGQLGLDTVVVEAAAPGGTCLNVGCIPSKALIHAANEFQAARHLAGPNALGITGAAPTIELSRTMAWKDGIVARLTGGVAGLMRKAKVRMVAGQARILDGKSVEVATSDGPLHIQTEHLVIATGSRPQDLPVLPFGGDILSSTEALSLAAVPRRLAIVGGGYIGLEIGTAMAKLGAEVTVVEAAPRLLPQYDAELTRPVAARLKTLGVAVLTGARAQGFADGALVVATAEGDRRIPADKVLVTVGRAAATGGFGLELLQLDMAGPFIAVDDRCRTSMHRVHAIGDVTGDPMLAHRAMAQGNLVAEVIAGRNAVWDKRAMPAVCFTDPEIVTVGRLPGDAPEAAVTSFPFAGNGRALTLERDDGFVRVVHDRATGLVLGIQAVGAGVSELAGQFALALEMAATLTDIAATIHAHPTLGETVQEAALKGLGQALHM
ncbi:dihydrolipoyl dehydrogenase [Tabrizicola oligotrophica]|uniref:Dihydrolipoyl dehydrogenase n=1 Tax=Tabrizicola oligotrophica TaxID=2710650 RepID=A0A6M0QTV5_9RHOB|nr:dihydrolipoyl dehydrogenase [Tabrizicola oligotrophica]NEY90073.1 dihydrolipoyl dehydrogenase [Tabrizicola oligotrophica]